MLLDTLPKSGKPCVYFVVSEGEVIYIGRSDNIRRRISQHARKEPQRIYIMQCESWNEARATEERMIWLFGPRLNVNREKLGKGRANLKELESWGLDSVVIERIRKINRVREVKQYGVCAV